MATVRETLKGSLRLIGAIATGETPSADEQADALAVLNEMLDSWSADGLMIPMLVREEFVIPPGQATYTFGTSGALDSSRPVIIEHAALLSSDGYETPIQILSHNEWAEVAQKNLTSTQPQKLYNQGSTPLETIHLWPIPSVEIKLVTYSRKVLSKFLNASENVSFPPGYAKAIRYNLAVELAPEYGRTLDAIILNRAEEAKEIIQRANTRPTLLSCDAAVLNQSSFNPITGE